MNLFSISQKKYFTLLVFLSVLVSIFIFHSPAINLGRAGGDLHWYVRTDANSFSEALGKIIEFRNDLEFRPLNHYLFHLIDKKLFGKNTSIFHILPLLLNSFNIILVYLLILKLTDNKRIAILSVLVFITRIALLRTYYIVSLSGPKNFFLLLLTFIFYLKAKEKNFLFIGLSVFSYFLAMLTRESFIFFPIGLLTYEIIYNYDRKINLTNLMRILKKISPYLVVVALFILIRLPYYIRSFALKEKNVVKISYRDVSTNDVIVNLFNFIRFHFNNFTVSFENIDLGNIIGLGIIDVVLYIGLLVIAHFIYSAIRRSVPKFPADLIKHLIWGGVWFFTFTFFYCFLGRIAMFYIYEGLLGSSLIIACLGEYYYHLFRVGDSSFLKGVVFVLVIHFLLGFYFLSRDRFENDEYLKCWKISAKYISSIKDIKIPISGDSKVHFYNKIPVNSHVIGNITGLDEEGGGFLFKYFFNNKDLEVVYHGSAIAPAKIRPGDIIFRLEKERMIYDTYNYGQIKMKKADL
jgi:hypothetical protein